MKETKKEIKVTGKTSKQGIINVLRATEITNPDLKTKVEATLAQFDKDMTTVSKEDLLKLVEEVLGAPVVETAPVESSLKPTAKKDSKKSKKGGITKVKSPDPEPVEEGTEAEETKEAPAPAEKTKKDSKKSSKKGAKKIEKKETEDVFDPLPPVSNVGVDNLPTATIFPKEIDHPDLGKLVSCAGQFTTYDEVHKALVPESEDEEGKTLYFACYWTKRQIKEYQYAAAKMIDPKTVKNGFPFDLDILMAVLPCETMERVFAMSQYTEALFQFEGEDFMPIEDTDPRSGKKFQIRASAGMEFEIYRPADEIEEENKK